MVLAEKRGPHFSSYESHDMTNFGPDRSIQADIQTSLDSESFYEMVHRPTKKIKRPIDFMHISYSMKSPSLKGNILGFLENGRWYEAYILSQISRDECMPIPCGGSSRKLTYRDTALGVACLHFTDDKIDAMWQGGGIVSQLDVIKAIYQACPYQIRCDQQKLGRTPLMNAIKNTNATLDLVKFMIDADLSCGDSGVMAALRRDDNGLSVLDHLINQMHQNAIISPNMYALQAVKYLIQKIPAVVSMKNGSGSANNLSPLILLLSHKAGSLSCDDEVTNVQNGIMPRAKRITKCAEALLLANPELIKSCSSMTGCTPLHLALRNGYGNNSELIGLLLTSDSDGNQVKTKNKFGDLPIHVAAAVGVSNTTISTLLDHILHTTSPSTNSGKCTTFDPLHGPNPFIWAMNGSGYNPVHLFWMTQVNGGKYQYPVNQKILLNNHHGKFHKEHYFYSTLDNAAKQVHSYIYKKSCHHESLRPEDAASKVLGQFWDFLLLILKATYHHSIRKKIKANRFLFLHAVLALPTSLLGLSIPRPIVDIALIIYPQQINEIDEYGRTPLHYACSSSFPGIFSQQIADMLMNKEHFIGWESPRSTFSSDYSNKESSLIKSLIKRNEKAALVPDKFMNLPLNYVIESEKQWKEECKSLSALNNSSRRRYEEQCSINWSMAVKDVVGAYPNALDWRNPNNHCYPFMQAATASENCVDSIYFMLRMSPTRVSEVVVG